jgi:hypothetical protein
LVWARFWKTRVCLGNDHVLVISPLYLLTYVVHKPHGYLVFNTLQLFFLLQPDESAELEALRDQVYRLLRVLVHDLLSVALRVVLKNKHNK